MAQDTEKGAPFRTVAAERYAAVNYTVFGFAQVHAAAL